MTDNNKFPIPRGWTYLRHGTHLEANWTETSLTHSVIISNNGLSCIERKEAIEDSKRGQDIARAYGGKAPIELRIFIYEESIRKQGANFDYLLEHLDENMRKVISTSFYYNNNHIGASGGRHQIIPYGVELLYLGQDTFDEISNSDDHPIYYYVPSFLLGHYLKDNNLNDNVTFLELQRQISVLQKRNMKLRYEIAELQKNHTKGNEIRIKSKMRKIDNNDWEIGIHSGIISTLKVEGKNEGEYPSIN